MRSSFKALLVSGLLTVTPFATALAAVEEADLSGEWVGTQRCEGLIEGEPLRFKFDSTLTITQTGTFVEIVESTFALTYKGRVHKDQTRANRLQLFFVEENTNAEEATGEIGRAERVNPKSGRFVGESLFGEEDEVLKCRWRYKRISAPE